MEKGIQELKEKFTNLNFESREVDFRTVEGTRKGELHLVSGINGNPDFKLILGPDEDLEELGRILENDIFLFPDFIAIKYGDTIEILLTSISFRTSFRKFDYDEKDGKLIIFNVGMNYQKNDLDILIEIGEDNLLPRFLKYMRGTYRYTRGRPTIMKIKNLKKESHEGLENDIRNIVNSILFDIEFSYDIAYETVNIDGLRRRSFARRRSQPELPSEKINLVYKQYIPELIQYFHIAEKVDFLPFKFICYYHIIEYFSDKSAYKVVSEEVKKLLLKPDFHLKTDKYVNAAINLFKKENDRHTNDKVKIERVLRQFVNREELKETLEENDFLEHYSKDLEFNCVKPLILPAINFDKENNFYQTLTKRIYAIRCSIVHSNPDFDESKAIPFRATPVNLEKLRSEIEMMTEIARNIIIESKENN